MMLCETPTVVQRSPFSSCALDQHAGHRLGAAVEDAHPVVDQLQILDEVLVLAEILAQRDWSSALTGPLPSAAEIRSSPPTCTFTTACATVTRSPARVVAPLDVDAELVTSK